MGLAFELMPSVSPRCSYSLEREKLGVGNHYVLYSKHAKSKADKREHTEPRVLSLFYGILNDQEGKWLTVLPNVTTKDSNLVGKKVCEGFMASLNGKG